MSQGEFDLVEGLRVLFDAGDVQVGIGDDAAVLAGDPRSLVLSVDTQVEHVHFERAWLTLEEIGHRAFATALSDLAAMGAEPTCALSALIVPESTASDMVPALARGQAGAARHYACPMVGGNLSRGDVLSITTTVIGRVVTAPLLRSAARIGQGVFVAGALGSAAAGLDAHRLGRVEPVFDAVRRAWIRPRAHVPEGLAALRAGATAAIDLSDGLAQDLAHLATASAVRVDLERAQLAAYTSTLEAAARALGVDPWTWVLFGGEDYALVVTANEAPQGFVRIGRIAEGSGVSLDGTPLPPRGHVHFGR